MGAQVHWRRVLIRGLVFALAGSVLAEVSRDGRLEELKALVEAGKYAEAESGARALLGEVEAASGTDSVEAAGVLDVLLESLWRGGKAREPASRALGERAVAIREKALGPDNAEVAASQYNLANLLSKTGDYATARQLYERALAIREKALGPDHPDVAFSLNNLALLLRAMGDYAVARPLHERALAILEKTLGPDHPSVATSLNNLANLLSDAGGHAAARPLYERALAIQEKTVGPDHPDVARSLTSLAGLLGSTGEYAAVRPLIERALAILEKTLGPDHPDVAGSLTNLAGLLWSTGDYAAARPLLQRALAIREKTLGPDHPDVAASLNNLGGLLRSTSDYATARPLYERALAIREKALSRDHPHLAASLNDLAGLLWSTGDYAAARPLYERALAILEKTLGPDHPDVAASLNNLAGLLGSTGEYAAARPLYERALAIREKTLSRDHPNLAGSLNDLAGLLWSTGDYAAARPLYERALAILEKTLGPDHPDVAVSLNNLASLLRSTSDYATARPLYERALAIREKALGPDHPDVAASLDNFAILLSDAGGYAAARPLHERALAIREKTLGPDHPDVARSLNSLAGLLGNTGEYAAARPLYERALAIREKTLGSAHPDVAATLNNLAELRAMQGETAGALDHALEAERMAREHLQLTARGLSERQALRYAAARISGLDLVLTLVGRGLDAASRWRAFDALVRSRAVVLDEMAARHRTVSVAADPEVAGLAASLSIARARLANLVVRGLGEQKAETYRKLLDDAQNEKEQAERALTAKSAEFRRQHKHQRIGLAEVAAAMLPSSTLAALLRMQSPLTAGGESATALGKPVPVAEAPPSKGALVAFVKYQHHPPLTTTVELSSLPTKPQELITSYLAFVLQAGQTEPAAVSLGPADEIENLVARWRGEVATQERKASWLAAARAGEEKGYRQAGEALRQRIWDPVAEHLDGVRQTFIVPDGALNLVSFAALPMGDSEYLIETGPLLHYLSAERDLLASELPTAKSEGLLALGGPSYDERRLFAALRQEDEGKTARTVPVQIASAGVFRGSRSSCEGFRTMTFGSLPGAVAEVKEVAARWHERTVRLEGSGATEAAFKRLAPGKRILHLATHGFFLGGSCRSAMDEQKASGLHRPADDRLPPVTGENPLLLSGLALAGANLRQAAGPEEEDGILTAEEIAALDLAGVEWTVLSACDTGLGEIRAGEGVFGLRRAFQVAGVKTVVMSLWPVEDHATRVWMNALYDARFGQRLGTAEAVREASLKVLRDRRAKKRSTHPLYWAGFVAAGDWR